MSTLRNTFLLSVATLAVAAAPALAQAPIQRNAPSGAVNYNGAPVNSGASPSANITGSEPMRGVWVRSDSNGGVQTVRSGGDGTELRVVHGRANVTVDHPEKNTEILVDLPGGQVALVKDGFYTFNAETNTVRVLDGQASAFPGNGHDEVRVEHDQQLTFSPGANALNLRAVDTDAGQAQADILPESYPQGGQNSGGNYYGSNHAQGDYYGTGPYAGGYGYGGSYGYGSGYGYSGYGYGYPAYGGAYYGGYPYYSFGYGYPYGGYGYGYPYGYGFGLGYYGGSYFRGYSNGRGGYFRGYGNGPGYRGFTPYLGNHGTGTSRGYTGGTFGGSRGTFAGPRNSFGGSRGSFGGGLGGGSRGSFGGGSRGGGSFGGGSRGGGGRR